MSFLLGGQSPDDLTPSQRRHLRLTHIVLLTLLVLAVAFVVIHLSHHAWRSAAVVSTGILAVLFGFVDIRRTGSIARTQHTITTLYFLFTLFVTVDLQGYSTNLIWLILMPVLSGVLLNFRWSLRWSVVGLTSLMLVWWLQVYLGLEDSALVTTPEYQHANILTLGAVLALLTLWLLREQSLALENLEESRQELRTLTGQLIRTDERTRNTLVTGLHEGVLQELFALRLLVTSSVTEEPLPPILLQIDRIDSQLRSMAVSLRPAIPDQVPLGAALLRLAQQAPTHLGMPINLSMPALPALSESMEKAVFLTIRELLFNAARHACAQTIQLRLSCEDATLRVDIIDDGVGFAPATRSRTGSGIGLRLCQERIESEGGIMAIESREGAGTHITLTLPLPA